jgi:hypothetical protein
MLLVPLMIDVMKYHSYGTVCSSYVKFLGLLPITGSAVVLSQLNVVLLVVISNSLKLLFQ